MKLVKINLNLSQSRTLHNEVRAIQGKLEHPVISRKKARALSQKLDRVCSKLFTIKNKEASPFMQAALDEMEQKIVRLYREIEESWVKRQIAQIQEETTSLKQALSCGTVSTRSVEELKKKIIELTSDYRPSLDDRRVIADAERTLELVNESPAGSQISPVYSMDEDLKAGEFEELLEIAYTLYEGNVSEAKRKFNQLPQDHKMRIQEHVAHLGGVLFTSYLQTQQALFATVNEIVQNGELYPSEDLIEDIFHELKILADHASQSSIVEFSLGA
ncbi:MAG: hypothetical protein K2P51_02860 [Rhabdochlamydiaceae bacterium]|nr:hypothetical protein [Rhabdochlamydiaceae bacterium]